MLYLMNVLCFMLLFVVFGMVMGVETCENEGVEKNIWRVLVGAFSDFGGLDTDNPVQIWVIFWISEVFPESEGLI